MPFEFMNLIIIVKLKQAVARWQQSVDSKYTPA